MKMKFKPGDLVIERTHRYPPSIRTAPRKGMIYRIIMRPGDTKWYEIHFFGSSTTIEWAKTYAHDYLEHYKVEDNENTV